MSKRLILSIVLLGGVVAWQGAVYAGGGSHGESKQSRKHFRRRARSYGKKHRAAKVNTKWEKRADKDHNGWVSRKEAGKAMHNYLKNRSKVDTKWEKRADKNGDGRIGRRELRHERQRREKRAATKDYLKNRSDVNKNWEKRADGNGDGKIDAKELKRARQERRHATADYLKNNSTVDKPWEKRADKNGDGKIDAKELEHFRAVRYRHQRELRKKFDTDHDGKLSETEAAAMKEFMAKRRAQNDESGNNTTSTTE